MTKNKQIESALTTKIKVVTRKEMELAQNNYILAFNDLSHKIIAQDYASTKVTAKDKKELKVMYEDFKQKTVVLNILYVKTVYQKINVLFKKTDLHAVMVYIEYEGEQAIMFHDYYLETGKDETGEPLYGNDFDNEVANDFFVNMDDLLNCALTELEHKLTVDMGGKFFLTKDMSYEDFLVNFVLTHPIGYAIDFDFSKLEPEVSEEMKM